MIYICVSENVRRLLLSPFFLGRNCVNLVLNLNCHTNSNIVDPNVSIQTIDEDELEKKRNKSRLPDRIYKTHIKKEMPSLEYSWTFNPKYLRRMYARYGEKSGLNPGIAWGTKEELKDKIDYDNLFHPPLQEILDDVKKKKERIRMGIRKREMMVEEAMARLEKVKQEVLERKAKQQKEIEAQQQKKQKLIEEVREFLGYYVDPKDERFKEIMEMKELEEKKTQKEAKKKLKYEKMMAKLLGVTQESKPTVNQSEGDNKENT